MDTPYSASLKAYIVGCTGRASQAMGTPPVSVGGTPTPATPPDLTRSPRHRECTSRDLTAPRTPHPPRPDSAASTPALYLTDGTNASLSSIARCRILGRTPASPSSQHRTQRHIRSRYASQRFSTPPPPLARSSTRRTVTTSSSPASSKIWCACLPRPVRVPEVSVEHRLELLRHHRSLHEHAEMNVCIPR